MHRIIIIIALAFLSTTLLAQSQLYSIVYSATSTPQSEIPDSNGLFQNTDKPTTQPLQTWVNAEYSRVRSTVSTEQIQITDKTTGDSYLIYPGLEAYEKLIDSLADQPSNSEDNAIEIRLISDSSKVIAGYRTHLALIDFHNQNQDTLTTIAIWYSPEIPSFFWDDYPYLKNLPGAALEIADNKICWQAQQIETLAFDQSLFELPANYNLQDYDISTENERLSQDNLPLGNDFYTYEDSVSHLIGLKNGQEKQLTEAKYSYISEFTSGMTTVTNAAGLYGLIDTAGTELIPCKWAYLGLGEDSPLVLFYEHNKAGFMDVHGQVLIPATYDYLLPFKHQYAAFSVQDKYGLLNEKGDVAVSANYETIVDHSNSHAIVIENNKYYSVEIAQNKKVSEAFDYLAFALERDLLVAEYEGLFGYTDLQGKMVIPFKFTSATPFYNGVAAVVLADGEAFKFINSKGAFVEDDHLLEEATLAE